MKWYEILTSQHYLHYSLVMTRHDKDIEYLMRKLVEVDEKWGFMLNVERAQYLCIS